MDTHNMTDKELLEYLMRENKWSQAKLAAELGMKDRSMISKCITGKSGISGSARKLADMLAERQQES